LLAITSSVVDCPDEIDDCFAVMLTVGTGSGTTVTVACADVVPPEPVAVAV
jgi:hypothetical protein